MRGKPPKEITLEVEFLQRLIEKSLEGILKMKFIFSSALFATLALGIQLSQHMSIT